jgi:hypothetical protein
MLISIGHCSTAAQRIKSAAASATEFPLTEITHLFARFIINADCLIASRALSQVVSPSK